MKLSIGELEKLTGINRTALRYYDSEGLVDPERMENGYRMYSQKDVMSLVQIKQLNAFGMELSELPGTGNAVSCRDIYSSLLHKEQEIEAEIEDLYQKIARLQLHVDAFRRCAQADTAITEGRMVGAYRLFYQSSEHVNDPKVQAVFRRWLNTMPYAYSVIRISRNALYLPPDQFCPVDTGIGLLSGAFQRMNEKMDEPIEYTPPCKCIQGIVHVKDPDQISRRVLDPFQEYLSGHGLIPLSDFHGWVIYTPVDHTRDEFCISLRIGVN
ncbi:MAG: MerR family transcriptional regulator [Clostridia bacterium]|nr:MerR family transcriptional regulator [Clostridia bacterium]